MSLSINNRELAGKDHPTMVLQYPRAMAFTFFVSRNPSSGFSLILQQRRLGTWDRDNNMGCLED